MFLRRLSISHFRNLDSIELSFGEPVTGFVGDNGQGKTNLLESVLVLSQAASPRAGHERQLIRAGSEFFRVVGEAVADSGESKTFELAAQDSGLRLTKQAKINGVKLSMAEFIGQLPVIAFLPDDLNLLLLDPGLRRRFLDAALAQLRPGFARELAAFVRALRQRNALLGAIRDGLASPSQLEIWDLELAQPGSRIQLARREFLGQIAEPAAARYREISAGSRQLAFELLKSPESADSPAGFLAELEIRRERDLAAGVTTFGPHRADLAVLLDGEPAAAVASRGELRTAVLALKFAELDCLTRIRRERPILLLDDVFSELDRGRQAHLLGQLSGYQTIATTTEAEHFQAIEAGKEILTIAAGRIIST